MGFSQCALLLAAFVLVISITLSTSATTTPLQHHGEKNSKPESPVTTAQLSEAVKGIAKPKSNSTSSWFSRQFRKDLSKRQPKFGMNFTIPGLTMASMDPDTFLGPTGLFGGTNTDKTGNPNVLGDIATIAAPLILLKGVSVAAFKVLKTIILPPIFFLVLLAFLIAGVIYFATAVQAGKDSMGTVYNRNAYEFEQPVYDALDNGYYKYNTYADTYNYDKSAGSNNYAYTEPEYTTYSYQPYTSRYSSYNNYIYPKQKESVRVKGT